MKPIELVRYIRANHRRYWDERLPHQARLIGEILGDPDFDPAQITKSVSDQYEPATPFLALLDDPDVQGRFAERLGVPTTLFEGELSAVQEYLSSLGHGRERGPSMDLDAHAVEQFQLGKNENQALARLGEFLLDRGYPWVNWSAPYSMGARFIATTCLRAQPRIAATYARIVAFQPSDRIEPYAIELQTLARELGLLPSVGFGAQLFDALRETKTLLILCNAERLRDRAVLDRSGMARGLIMEAIAKKNRWNDPTCVLTVGSSGHLDKVVDIDNRHDVSASMRTTLAVPVEERLDFFEKQWLRFCRERGYRPEAEIGSRLKRSLWHYDRIEEAAVWPINLRLRAFFASNFANHSYSDPTQGFMALAGPGPLPADISFFEEDVKRHLGDMPPDGRGTSRAALRFVSTAKYWLTDAMLEELCKGGGDTTTRKASAVRKELSDANSMVQEVTVSGVKRYVVGIGVKAVLQDEWISQDPYERAWAHYRVAKRLWEAQNNRELLAREFPYQPSWGRSRIYFLSECIRHLVRTCLAAPEKVDHDSEFEETRFDASGDFLVQPPSPEWLGCNPYQVVNFCYRVIFQKHLNGNTSRGDSARALTKRNGAYPLALELLQLMSMPGDLGTPHWALDSVDRRSFTTETGFASLNMGDLKTAERCFRQLVEGDQTGLDARTRADDRLNLSLVHVARDELLAAEALTDEAEALLFAAYSESTLPDAVRKRLTGRKAHLSYLKKDYSAAAAQFHELDVTGEQLTDPYLVDAYVKSLERLRTDQREGIQDGLPDALDVSIEKTFRVLGEGHQHEGMGYKITLAYLLRKRGVLGAAETVLDDVHRGVFNYGASERTYLAFMLEAGRVLMRRGSPVRALACYLLPCLKRSRARGLTRLADAAHYQAISAVEEARVLAKRAIETSQDADGAGWANAVGQIQRDDKVYRGKLERSRPPGVDPLDGYDLASAEKTIARFATIAGIDLLRSEIMDQGPSGFSDH